MMMSLDEFLFEIGTLPFQQLQQQWEWRFAETERFGARPAAQYVGIGAETVTLTGALYPGIAGDYSSLGRIRGMASRGDSYIMLNGRYEVMGQFTIRRLSLTSETFFVDGVARKADFSLELKREE